MSYKSLVLAVISAGLSGHYFIDFEGNDKSFHLKTILSGFLQICDFYAIKDIDTPIHTSSQGWVDTCIRDMYWTYNKLFFVSCNMIHYLLYLIKKKRYKIDG